VFPFQRQAAAEAAEALGSVHCLAHASRAQFEFLFCTFVALLPTTWPMSLPHCPRILETAYCFKLDKILNYLNMYFF